MNFRRFLSIFLTIALILSLVPAAAFPARAATSGTIDDCRWSLSGTVLTVTGKGILYRPSSGSPWGTDITKVIIKSGITDLSLNLFQDCTKLTSVTLPDTVEYIGYACFKNCTALTSITLPSGITSIGEEAFYGCTALTSVSLPQELKRISYRAFYNCGLTSVQLPQKLQTIGIEAFYSCSLTSLTVPDSVTQVERNAFGANKLASITFGKGLTYIHPDLFGHGWKTLTVSSENANYYSQDNCIIYRKDKSLVMGGSTNTLPAGITAIGDSAFLSTQVTAPIPNTVKSIGHYAFQNCDSLTNVTVPDSVTSMGSSVFFACDNLTSATLSSKITKLPGSTFKDCIKLRQVTYRGQMVEIGNQAFCGCANLEEAPIPETVTVIGDYAFQKCTAMTSLTIPQGVESIPIGTFNNCTSLTEVTIPSNVTTIGTSAFGGCSALSQVSFPEGLTVIDTSAFAACHALEDISLPSSLVEVYDNTFEGTAYYDNTANWESCALYLGDVLLDYKDDEAQAHDYVLRQGTRVIAGNAFSSTYYLKNVTLPDSLTHIGPRAFYAGYQLATVTFGEGLVSIGDSAFYNCDKLTDVTLGDRVTSIGAKAFNGCDGLKNVRLGSSLTTIGEAAFDATKKLERVEVSTDNSCFYSQDGKLYDAATGKVLINPTNRQLLLTINYLDSRGNPIATAVNSRRSLNSSYSYTSPEISFHTPTKAVVSGKLSHDLTVDVIYYEQVILASGTCGSNIKWTLYDDGTLVLRGTGKMPAGVAPWKSHSDAVITLTLDSRITAISAGAFENLPNLTRAELGYGITSIGDNAFSGCSSLSTLSLPDSLTAIGAGSFSGTALTKLTIPDAVQSLGNGCFRDSALKQIILGTGMLVVDTDALAGCESLTQVIFRGNPTALGTNALGSTEGKLVLYYPSVERWNTAVVDGVWNGYTAVPRQVATRDTVTAADILMFKVVDRHNDPLAGAVVTLAGQTQAANQDGMVWFLKPTSPVELRISCSDHLTFVNPAYLPGGFRVEYVELSDKPSAVWGIAYNSTSIATDVVTVNCNSAATVALSVGGYSKYEITKYELWQGNRLLASRYTSASSTIFNVKANTFQDSQTVFVKMYTADGSSVATALNLRTLWIAEVSQLQLIDELSRLKLHLELESLGSYDLPLSFQSDEQKIYAQVNGSTIRIGVNIDVDELFEEEPNEVTAKTKVQKAVQEYLRSSVNGKAGFGCDVAGYLEIECLGNDEYAVRTCYVKVAVAAELSFKAQASYFGIVGVYFKASLSATGSLDLLVTGFASDTGLTVEDANLGLENAFTLEGGAFLLWGAGSAALYGKLTMGFQLGLVPDVEFESVYISGEMGVKWSVFWGLFSGSKKLLSGDFYRWPETKHLALNALSGSNLQFNDRSYLENRSPWLSGINLLSSEGPGETLRFNTNYNVNAQVVTCGDTTVMVWLEDNESRDDSNFQTLYYSLLDPETGLWSQPAQVDSNDTFDCEFHLYTDGMNIYVLYTEQKGLLSGVDAMDPNDPKAVADLIGGIEVSFAQFREGGFDTPIRLTDNDVCETLPVLFGGETLQAVWCAAATMDTTAQSGSGALYTSRFENGSWTAPTALTQTQRTISLLTVLADGYIVYTSDGDGDSATTADTRLILLDPTGTAHQLAQGEITGLSALENRLVWIENGVLWMLESPEGAPVCLEVSATGTCQLLKLEDNWLVCYTAAGQTGTELYALYLEGGKPVALTETQGSIDRFSVTLLDGRLVAVFTETQITDAEAMTATTSLRWLQTPIAPQAEVGDVYFDVTGIRPNEALDLELTVTNIGLAPMEQVTVTFTDSNGTVLLTQSLPLALASGATGTLTVSPVLSGEISSQSYTLELSCSGTSLSIPVMLSFADISLNAQQSIIGGQSHLRLEAVNLGNRPTAADVTVSTADGTVLHQFTTGILAAGEAESFFLDISRLSGGTLVICQATSLEPDGISLNDRCVITLFQPTEQGIPADPEAVPLNPVLSAYSAQYDRYQRTPISFLIHQGWDSFTGITGLTTSNYTLTGKTVTLNSSYLYNLPNGLHTLELTFSDGSIRTFTLTVVDSTPIYLYGEMRITGTVAVGQTLFADCTGLTPVDAKLSYNWTVAGVTVSETNSYTIRPEDQGKSLFLTVSGIDGYSGTYYDSKSIPIAAQEQPLPPVVAQVAADSVTLVTVSGLAYSLDGTTWQDNGKFTGLTPNTGYVFYVRNEDGLISQGVSVTTAKLTAETPEAPEILEVTDQSVTLREIPGCLYSLDGTTWQSSPCFTGLSPNTAYVFYQKLSETDTHYASEVSEGTVAVTLKTTPAAPAAPVVEKRSSTTVSLEFVVGYEYSMDGIHWQGVDSGLWHSPSSFTGLTPNTYYTFYQRIGETENANASPASEPLVIRTWKHTQGDAPTPVIEAVTHYTITVAPMENMEYKLEVYNGSITKEEQLITGIWGTAEEPIPDSTGWQSSNVFTDLQPDTCYIVYQRYAPNANAYAGSSGDGITVSTLARIPIAGQLQLQGQPRVGQTLVCQPVEFTGDAAQVAYQWYADGVPISGATADSYTLTPEEAGKTVTLTVTGTGIWTGTLEAVLEAPVYLPGDVNGDNKANMRDWVMVYNHICETTLLPEETHQAADVNGDGKINMKDWLRLYNHISEISPLW